MAKDQVPLFVRLPREQAAALDRLAGSTGRRKQRIVSELLADGLTVGRAEVSDAGEEVLSLAQAAALLRLPEDSLRERVLTGELPARRFGADLRFSRQALLAWLAEGDEHPAERSGDGADG